MNPVNVLYVYGDILRHGGIENFMMNYFRNIDSNVIHIDFAVQGKRRGAFDDEIESAGSCIYRLPKPGRNPFRYTHELKKIFKSGRYQIIHSHCDAMNFRILRLAEECNVPVRISHSHNINHVLQKQSILKIYYYEYSRKKVAEYASICYACSEKAGRWMYGNRHFKVIPNAIELDKFLFDSDKRKVLRNRYNISENTIVLGNVGRFDVQKNQLFLVDLLKMLSEKSREYRLLLVGNGWMRKHIEKKIREYNLKENVIFTGEVDNPQDYYNMMDIFLMPSLFEGYAIALEEAEVNGLPCLASEYVPEEVEVLNHIDFIRLDKDVWMKKILKLSPVERYADATEELKKNGYDIKVAAKRLQNEYIRLYREAREKGNV